MIKYKKFISFILALSFITIILNHSIATNIFKEDKECHGFIVSLIKHENSSFENQINCRIKHMINDLLSEQITVYWTTTKISVLTDEKVLSFDKGAFIIPFSNDALVDSKLIAIVYNYNNSCEIEENPIKIPVYKIMETLDVEVYELFEPKIAIFKSKRTTGERYYLDAATKCGFLNIEYIEDKNLPKKLNNSAFNILIWSAGVTHSNMRLLGEFFSGFNEWFSGIPYNKYGLIRNFIRNGGGYVGSCYGSFVASSSIFPIPVYLKRRVYNPNLPAIGLLAVSDVVAYPIITPIGICQEKIVDNTHPVTYGIQTVLSDSHFCGPKFLYVGKNSQVVANFYNTSNFLDGTPSWISSEFGSGNVMLFSGHPEFIDSDAYPYFIKPPIKDYYVGKNIISNTFFYLTTKNTIKLEKSQSKTLSFINEMFEKTNKIRKNELKNLNLFSDVKQKINLNLLKIKNLTNEINSAIDLICEIENEKNMDNKSINHLGKFYIYSASHCSILLEEHLKNSINKIQTLENVYSLIKNNPNFLHELKDLKSKLLKKSNQAIDVLIKCIDLCNEFKQKLQDYNSFNKLQKYFINNKAKELSTKINLVFQYIPLLFVDLLKFLRHNWYGYQSNISL